MGPTESTAGAAQGATNGAAVEAPPAAASAPDAAAVPPDSPPARSATTRAAICRVLFVGGEGLWFQQVERDLLCLQPDWYCWQVRSSAQALGTLAVAPFDAVVVHSRLPENADLLETIQARFPRALRLLCCHTKDRAVLAQCHRAGATPVDLEADAAALAAILQRAAQLQVWLAAPALQRLLPHLRKLPATPKLYARVTEELRSESSSLEVVAGLIAQDPVMAAKILQVANSAFFGLAYEVEEPAQAVMFLGTERTRALILLAGIFSQFDDLRCPGFSAEPIWNHSLQTATFARAIALAETKDAKTAEAAFTAGLLHDIGKLLLAGNVPDQYQSTRKLQTARRCPHHEAELEVLGATHAEVGACLLGTWGLPLPMLEALAWHHCPERSGDTAFALLTAVHAANAFAQEAGFASSEVGACEIPNLDYLWPLGLHERLNTWRKLCGLEIRVDAATPGG